jgi:phosphoribosylcarboxyaminoimidazole (NCAIR) mutase
MRRGAIIIGSDSDLPQCIKGFEYLMQKKAEGLVEIIWVDTASQHRNTLRVQEILTAYHGWDKSYKPDFIITGAGWANHLTGCSDAFLRYILEDDEIVVFGVPFDDAENPKHAIAALYSISEVPGTQVVFHKEYIGDLAFLWACQQAVEGELPKIKVKPPKPPQRRTIEDALGEALKLERKNK